MRKLTTKSSKKIEYYTLQPMQLHGCTNQSGNHWFRGGLVFYLNGGSTTLCSKCFQRNYPNLFQPLLDS
ncbi:hypothetical protein [Nostoc sp. CCY 9925]|uniref:hypothetical protein n=1 Tax=Nostoc sp. CCY 9925 TaxID=3103865 RepID=UPI0039C60F4A